MFYKVLGFLQLINPILYSDKIMRGQKIFQFPDTLKILMNVDTSLNEKMGSVKIIYAGTLVNPLESFSMKSIGYVT